GAEFPGTPTPPGALVGWDYAIDLLPAATTTGPGVTTTFRYDAAGRDLETDVAAPAGERDHLVTVRDGFGRVAHRIRSDLHSTASRHDSLGWLDRVEQGPAVPVPSLDAWRPGDDPDSPA